MLVKIKKLEFDSIVPSYAHPNDSGMDLFARVYEETIIYPGQRELIGTGISIELPPGYEAQIRPRSGLAIKDGITVLNTPGTVDAGYRGEIKVILYNSSGDLFEITNGMKIAQMVIAPVIQAEIQVVEELEESSRGTGGFGSTGI